MDDVYFSIEDGLEETRAVFLAGCNLPARWSGRSRFTVAELGFGTGLNLLALWQMWKANRPSPTARLDFVSFEGFPMAREAAARALARWPELSQLRDALLAKWPVRARGVQHIPLGDGLSLTLHIDDIARALPNSRFKADAWFLDGFSPAKNESMWAADIYPLLMARSAPGAQIGTYTVAGAVRRGLAAAGFDVSKQAGFGRKRDRLQAIAPLELPCQIDVFALETAPSPPRSVAIIGAGIAGASTAHIFAKHGAQVTLFDTADTVGAGASGNPLALLMPRLDASDTAQARVLLASYLTARQFYTDLPGTHPITVHQCPRHSGDDARFQKLLADPPLPPDFLSAHPKGGLAHHKALILEPAELISALIGNTPKVLGAEVSIDLANQSINGTAYDMIILANGMAINQYKETNWLPLSPRLGQIEYRTDQNAPPSAIASGHYALALEKTRLWGATFEPMNHAAQPVTTMHARAENNAALAGLGQQDWSKAGLLVSRAGVRATTADKLPFAGRAPNFDQSLEAFASVRKGIPPNLSPPVHPGIWLVGGLGARGFTFAPWLAKHLAALCFGAPAPLGRAEAELISPMRFIYRDLKRGRL
jgi:tRNA 5-methylaminomethyl-2-thiouridine biosynthesis bifunctional protein